MNKWLPIATAPKDGTVIDIWTGYRRETDVHWDGTHWRIGSAVFSSPTHWMPRPDNPPKEDGVLIQGVFIPFADLQNDVDAAISKGFANRFAFTPETVQALLSYIRNDLS